MDNDKDFEELLEQVKREQAEEVARSARKKMEKPDNSSEDTQFTNNRKDVLTNTIVVIGLSLLGVAILQLPFPGIGSWIASEVKPGRQLSPGH